MKRILATLLFIGALPVILIILLAEWVWKYEIH